jgi:hypothetical protein
MQSHSHPLRDKYRIQITSREHGPSRVPSVAEWWLRGCAPPLNVIVGSFLLVFRFSLSLSGAALLGPPPTCNLHPSPSPKKHHAPNLYLPLHSLESTTTTRNKNTYHHISPPLPLLSPWLPSLPQQCRREQAPMPPQTAPRRIQQSVSLVSSPSLPLHPACPHTFSRYYLLKNGLIRLFAFQFNSIRADNGCECCSRRETEETAS